MANIFNATMYSKLKKDFKNCQKIPKLVLVVHAMFKASKA